MDQSEITELINKSRADGVRLYQASEWLYKLLLALTVVVGALGLLASFAAASAGGIGMLAAGLVATVVVVLLLYATAVLSTHISKVLVHLLFANLVSVTKALK